MGKTALLERFLSDVADSAIVRAAGVESEVELEFGIIDQLLARRAERGRDHLEAGRDLLDLLDQLETDATVTLVIEDAHWVDAGSLRAILFAIRRLVSERVLTVLTVRHGELEHLPHALRAMARGGEVDRRALTDGEVEALAAARGITLSARGRPGTADAHGRQPAVCAGTARRAARRALERRRRHVASSALLRGARRRPRRRRPGARPPADRGACGRRRGRRSGARGADRRPRGAAGRRRRRVGHRARDVRRWDAALRSPAQPGGGVPRPRDRGACAVARARERRGGHRGHRTAPPRRGRGGDRRRARGGAGAVGHRGPRARLLARGLDRAPRREPVELAAGDRERRLLEAAEAALYCSDRARARRLVPQVEALPPSSLRDGVLAFVAIALGQGEEAEALLASAWERADPERDRVHAAKLAERRAYLGVLRDGLTRHRRVGTAARLALSPDNDVTVPLSTWSLAHGPRQRRDAARRHGRRSTPRASRGLGAAARRRRVTRSRTSRARWLLAADRAAEAARAACTRRTGRW